MRILRYVGRAKTLHADYRAALEAGDVAVVDTLPGDYNVTLSFRRDGVPVHIPLRNEIRDLLDVGVTTYIGDELVARGDAVDGWTRQLDYVLPVQDPGLWVGVEAELGRVLRILSGDRYSFSWLSRAALPARVHHRQRLPSGYDVVCLFSGGLDSFLGAYQLLSEGRRVILAGHQAEGITAAAQKELARFLRGRFPHQCTLIQCRVARGLKNGSRYALPEKVEETHRPRSFLFLIIALAVARAAGINELVIAENGLIALNVPLQRSRLGTLSTRTAHPRYLVALLDFFAAGGFFTGRLWNPFLFQSKTDVLRDLPAELHAPVLRSVSCAHAGRVPRKLSGRKGLNHCGYCVPCLYRRVALIGAGIDRAEHYAVDVFRQLPALTPAQQVDFRALVRFAVSVRQSAPAELEAMVLSHGFFPASVSERLGPQAAADYAPWREMLSRWAEDFLQHVERSPAPTLRVLGFRKPRQEATR